MEPGLLSLHLQAFLDAADSAALPSPRAHREVEIRCGVGTGVAPPGTEGGPLPQRGLDAPQGRGARHLGASLSGGAFPRRRAADPQATAIQGRLEEGGFLHVRDEESITVPQSGGRLVWQQSSGWRQEAKAPLAGAVDLLLPAYGVDLRLSVASETPIETPPTEAFVELQRRVSGERHRRRRVWCHPRHPGWEVHATWIYTVKGERVPKEEYHVEVERVDASATAEAATRLLLLLLPLSALPFCPDRIDNPYPYKCTRNMHRLWSASHPFPTGVMLHSDVLRRKDLKQLKDGEHALRYTFEGSMEVLLTHCRGTGGGAGGPHLYVVGGHHLDPPRGVGGPLCAVPSPRLRAAPRAGLVQRNLPRGGGGGRRALAGGEYSERMAWAVGAFGHCVVPSEEEIPIVAAVSAAPSAVWPRLLCGTGDFSTRLPHGVRLPVAGLVAHSETGNRVLAYRNPGDLVVDTPVSWSRHTRDARELEDNYLVDDACFEAFRRDDACFEAFRRHFPAGTREAVGRFVYKERWILLGPSMGPPFPPSLVASTCDARCDHLALTEVACHFRSAAA